MEKHIENIIKEKRFIELSSDEKRMVAEWAKDEESFNDLQFLLRQVPTYTEKTIHSAKNKQKLDKLFYEVHGGTPSQRLLRTFFPPLNISWNWFSPTLVGALGSLIIGSFLFFWFTNNESDIQKPQTKTSQKQEVKKENNEKNSSSEHETKVQIETPKPILVASNSAQDKKKLEEVPINFSYEEVADFSEGYVAQDMEALNDFSVSLEKSVEVEQPNRKPIPSMSANEDLFNVLSASY